MHRHLSCPAASCDAQRNETYMRADVDEYSAAPEAALQKAQQRGIVVAGQECQSLYSVGKVQVERSPAAKPRPCVTDRTIRQECSIDWERKLPLAGPCRDEPKQPRSATERGGLWQRDIAPRPERIHILDSGSCYPNAAFLRCEAKSRASNECVRRAPDHQRGRTQTMRMT